MIVVILIVVVLNIGMIVISEIVSRRPLMRLSCLKFWALEELVKRHLVRVVTAFCFLNLRGYCLNEVIELIVRLRNIRICLILNRAALIVI